MNDQPPYGNDPQNSGWQQPAPDMGQAGMGYPDAYPPSFPPPPVPPAPGYVPPHLQAPTNPSGYGQAYPTNPTSNIWQTNPPNYGGAPYGSGPAYTNPHTYPPPPPPPYNPSQPLYTGMAGQQGGYSMPGMMGPVPPGYGHPPAGSAIAVEAILAIFGFYGIGWLMSGKTTTGTLLLVGGLVWAAIAIFIAVFTAGFGLCCLVPIHGLFIVLSTVMLANQRIFP